MWCSRRLVTWTSIPKLPVWLTELAGILRSPRADPFEPHLAARYSPHRTPQSPVSSPQSALPRALRTSVFPQSTQTFAISCCPAVEGIRRQQVSNVAPGQVPSCSYTSHLGALGTTFRLSAGRFPPNRDWKKYRFEQSERVGVEPETNKSQTQWQVNRVVAVYDSTPPTFRHI